MTDQQKKDELLADAFEMLGDLLPGMAMFNTQHYYKLKVRYDKMLQAEADRQKQWNEFYDADRARVVSKLNNKNYGKT